MDTLFRANDERKRSKRDKVIHKAMIIIFDIHQENKEFYVTVQQKNVCKLEFTDHLWLLFVDQPQSGIIVLAIIIFHIYNILVKKWKHGIGANYIITFNE